jgi:hypothetical protein
MRGAHGGFAVWAILKNRLMQKAFSAAQMDVTKR